MMGVARACRASSAYTVVKCLLAGSLKCEVRYKNSLAHKLVLQPAVRRDGAERQRLVGARGERGRSGRRPEREQQHRRPLAEPAALGRRAAARVCGSTGAFRVLLI